MDKVTKEKTLALLKKSAQQADEQSKQSKPQQEGTFTKGSLLSSHYRRLWERMTEIYAHKWTSVYGVEPVDTWVRGLSDMEPDDIAKGLEACLTNGDGWPPSLPEFRQLCRPAKVNRINAAMYEEKPKALPEPEEYVSKRKQNGIEQINKIKQLMGKK